jgi:hypothetical protein
MIYFASYDSCDPVTPVIFLLPHDGAEMDLALEGDMNMTILLALIVAGAAVFLLTRVVVHSIARKGERAAQISR